MNTSDLLKTKGAYQNDLKKLEKELNESKYKIQTAALLKDDVSEASSKDSHKEKLEKIVNVIFYFILALLIYESVFDFFKATQRKSRYLL